MIDKTTTVSATTQAAPSNQNQSTTAMPHNRRFLGWIVGAINSVINNAVSTTQTAVEETSTNLIDQATNAANSVINNASTAVQQTIDSGLDSLNNAAEDAFDNFQNNIEELATAAEEKEKQREKEAAKEAKQQAKAEKQELHALMQKPVKDVVLSNGNVFGSFRNDELAVLGSNNNIDTSKRADTVSLSSAANNNVINGGGGNDLLELGGLEEDYRFEPIGGRTFNVINTKTGTTNIAIDFERIRFGQNRSKSLVDIEGLGEAFAKKPNKNKDKDKEDNNQKPRKNIVI